MLNRRPKIHRQRTNLNFSQHLLLTQRGLHRVFHDHMEAAIAAFFVVRDVVFFVKNLKILTHANIFRNPADILNELTHNANARDILDPGLQILHRHI